MICDMRSTFQKNMDFYLDPQLALCYFVPAEVKELDLNDAMTPLTFP